MKQNLPLLALVILIMFLMPMVSKAQKMKEYKVKDGYSISIPDDWKQDLSDKEISFSADYEQKSESDSQVESMVVGIEDLGEMTAAEYQLAFKDDKDSNKAYTFLKTGDETVGGVPGKYYLYRAKADLGGGDMIFFKEKMLVFVKNKIAYKMIFITTESTYTKMEPVFAKIIRSFKFQ